MVFSANLRNRRCANRTSRGTPWLDKHSRNANYTIQSTGALEQVGLLHDAEELFLVDFAITISVRLVDHLLELLVRHALTQLLRNALQVLEGDLASLIIVKETESLQDLILGIAVEDLVGHHLEKFFVPDGAASIIVHVSDHLLNFLL